MGLISDEQGKFAVLSDILGDEDHLGDMDFKVAGTVDGITATQMDIKVDGLSYEVLTQALEQARRGRLHILDKMMEVISEPREDYKDIVPRLETIVIPKEFIGAVIGPGGKIIQKIQEDTQTVITIEEIEDKGYVQIAGTGIENIKAALNRVKMIVAVPEVGDVYTGKVKSILAFGAFVEVLPGKDGLLHISELDYDRHETVEEVLKEGDMVTVKLIAIEDKTGKLKLSRKALLEKPEGYVEPERGEGAPRRSNDRGGRRDDRGGGRRDDRGGRRDDRHQNRR
jgi:polyribonucleotide nucleotidyltransferase